MNDLVSEYQQYKNFIEGLARKLNQAIILEEVK
jgi:hypothetical protein